MPKSDDISALYDQFNGNANSFREIGRTARAAEASSRWPLFSHMAQERGASVPSAGDQTPDAATQHHQAEPASQLTPSDSETQLPPAWLQRTSEVLASDPPDAVHPPPVWNMGRRPVAAPTTAQPTASTPTPPAFLSEISEPTLAKLEPSWLQVSAVQPAAMSPSKPASPSSFVSAGSSRTPSPSPLPLPAFPSKPETSPQTGASPLRRLVRVDPPNPDNSILNDAPPAENLMSVFSRLAGRSSGERER